MHPGRHGTASSNAARPLRLRSARSFVCRMTADEVVTGLLAVAGVRRTVIGQPFTTCALVSGIEVVAIGPTPERALRALWRERRGNGATPLLILAEDPTRTDCVVALGAVDASGPIRSVDAVALSAMLHRLVGKSRLDAVRELAAELERLDRAGIPGLKLRELLTLHTLDSRLRRDVVRWQLAQDTCKSINRNSEWKAILTELGYQIDRRRHRGWLARYDGRPIAVVHPVRAAVDFTRLDDQGRPPEGLLLNDCEADGAPFGMMASGGRIRLFRREAEIGSASARYLDVDAASLRPEDHPFLALLGPTYLADGEFEKLQTEARDFGAALSRRLDDTIRQTVLPALGTALGDWASRAAEVDLEVESVRQELERASLTLIFRMLFIAYAESTNYLPMDNRSYRQNSLTGLVDEAVDSQLRLGSKSTSLWDRFTLLVKALRLGNPAWGVPAYNGALFASDGFDGASMLERFSIADPDFANVLIGVGRDRDTASGVDYSTLEIGHLGHIYEGLLSLQLSITDVALAYDSSRDRYVPVVGNEHPDVVVGGLLWQTNEGGRKGGGVYYTRTELVRHLVRTTVVPAFDQHLQTVRSKAELDPDAASRMLFDFAVLDPSCGSAHFLVEVVNEMADQVVKFLAGTPLPAVRTALERLRAGATAGAAIDDVALLRRLVLKRCVFGVDVSPMGAEVAKLSLWLASFVPGLSLAYLGRNVIVGNSLIGVDHPSALRVGDPNSPAFWDQQLADAVASAAAATARVAEGDDRNPEEVDASMTADDEAHTAVVGLQRLFDLWTSQPFGVAGARDQVELFGPQVISGEPNSLLEDASNQRTRHSFLHWPLAFPHVFSRERPGFDAVVGNPPWEEVTVEAQSFYALFRPGIRRGISESERDAAVDELLLERPDLLTRLTDAQSKAAEQRAYFAASGYESMAGDPDLYKFFCQRYRSLLRVGGSLGVVLPRTTFVNLGSEEFRRWMFKENTCRRIDFMINSRLWAFDTHAQFTVALVVADRKKPPSGHTVSIAGTAGSVEEWNNQVSSPGISLREEAFGPGWTPPLLSGQAEADLLAKLRVGREFPFGAGDAWRCFPVAELHETNDRGLWQNASTGKQLWKGSSFQQYDPNGAEMRLCPDSTAVRKKVQKPRPGAGSRLAEHVSLKARQKAVLNEIDQARVAFRDVTQKTNSRTVLACLVPPDVFLSNTAPYLVFSTGDGASRAACLGILNSLAFDWQARRFVEIHLNFFILEGLIVPNLSTESLAQIAECAARLSCTDDRFADFATSVGVSYGPISEEEQIRLRVEIDALVARAWCLNQGDLDVMFADFTLTAVTAEYRRQLQTRLAEIS